MLDHRQRLALADDEVVEHTNVDQFQGLLEPMCELHIGLARLRDTRGMVVAENQRSSIVSQSALEHLPGIHTGAVDSAAKQHFKTE
ncbi:hypothetical protein D3C77_656110 [compost metagenome]